MKLITLYSRGKPNLFAKVDDEDYNKLNQYRWHYHIHGSKPRAMTGSGCNKWLMHQLILPKKDGLEVDHIDGDNLNNQKVNLRYCTRSQNLANRRRNKNNVSGFKGVTCDFRHGTWTAELMVDRVRHRVSGIKTAEEAAHCYDKMAKKYQGEFARLNFP